jgi:hypothetical protein
MLNKFPQLLSAAVPSPEEVLKWSFENNSNFKPAEMLFEFRNGMHIRRAKPLLQVRRGLYSVGSHE